MALRLLRRDAQLERTLSGPAADRRQRGASRGIRRARAGSLTWIFRPRTWAASITASRAACSVFVKFLGLLGPQGALPLTTTEESLGWVLMRDDAFPRFLDLFNHRFLQLFFRAWADARPIAQHDRPRHDRFIAYIGSMIGIGIAARIATSISAGPGQARVRGPDRAAGEIGLAADELHQRPVRRQGRDRGVRRHLAGVRSAAIARGSGAGNSELGTDLLVGASIFSVQDKIRIRIYTSRTWRSIERFLADRRPVRAAGRRGILLHRRSARLGSRTGDSGRRESRRPGSARSGSSAGPAGCRRTGPRRTNTGAMRVFIRRNACGARAWRTSGMSLASQTSSKSKRVQASAEGEPWPTSALKPSPAN